MPEITSFVFFDIETTDFGDGPEITAIAFSACLRQNLLETTEGEIPRALYKVLLPMFAQKKIGLDACEIKSE